jgi:hypothetical protein
MLRFLRLGPPMRLSLTRPSGPRAVDKFTTAVTSLASPPTHPVVWLFIGTAALAVWLDGARHSFISCAANCGEAFDALQYVENFRLYGFTYGLIQDMATSPVLAGHPFLYTHNVNLAGILFVLLDAVGVTALWAKQLLTLAAFAGGLYYVYRATAYHSRSVLLGGVALLLFATDYEHVLSFGLNPLRAWHWLVIFGLLFHVGRLAGDVQRVERTDQLLTLVFATLAFGIGYDFWIICLFISSALTVLILPRPRWSQNALRCSRWLVGGFLVPLALRQVQIAVVLGPSFWAKDLYYSVLIKVSLLNRLLPPISTADVDQFYATAGVLRPPAVPASSTDEVLGTLHDMLTFVTIPTAGLLPVVLAMLVGVACVVVAMLDATWPSGLARLLPNARRAASVDAGEPLLGVSRMVAALLLGTIVGLGVFAPLSLHVYLKHQFPLVAAPLLLTEAIVITALIRTVSGRGALPPVWLRWAAMVSLCILSADHFVVQADDLRAAAPVDLSWTDAVTKRSGSTFAVSWIPNSVSSFTDNWVVGVQPGKEQQILERLRQGGPPFEVNDYFLFGERDAAQHLNQYLSPDYWLYFPTDQTPDFDRPSPTCRQDYLTHLIASVLGSGTDGTPHGELNAVSPQSGPPGTLLTVAGKIAPGERAVSDVALVLRGKVVAYLPYNCQYDTFAGNYQVPSDASEGILDYQIRTTDDAGQPVTIAEFGFMLDRSVSKPMPRPYPTPQPTVDQILTKYPDLPVAARGNGYVIFDLRDQHWATPTPDQVIRGALSFQSRTVPQIGDPVVDEAGRASVLNEGDLLWLPSSGDLVELGVGGRITHLTAGDNQEVGVRNVGPWDSFRAQFVGARAVFQDGHWHLQPRATLPSALPSACASDNSPGTQTAPAVAVTRFFAVPNTASNCNSQFQLGTDLDPIPYWHMTTAPDAYVAKRMVDNSGEFVRITASRAVPLLAIYAHDPLDSLVGQPVALHAQIRAQTRARHVLTLHVGAGGGNAPAEFTAETPGSGDWITLATPAESIDWQSPESNFSLGLSNVSGGDWFDVRELSLVAGTSQPANVNSDFRLVQPGDPIPGWTLSPSGAGADVRRFEDQDGPFVRVRATRPNAYVVLSATEPLAHLDDVPASLLGLIRVHGLGEARLTVTRKDPNGQTQTAMAQASPGEAWTKLVVRMARQNRSDPQANFALGVYGLAEGDWFDVRQFALVIGVEP